MDSGTAVLLSLIVFFIALAIRVPVAFSLLLGGGVGIFLIQGERIMGATLKAAPVEAIASYGLIVVPLFILMGAFAANGALARDLFVVANRFMHRVPGGLGLAALAASAGFAAITGSSTANVAAMGKMAVDEMRKYGYPLVLAAGIIGSAGTLGVLIPPSVILVLYALTAGESVGGMLLAGVLPGLVSILAYGAIILWQVRRVPAVVEEAAVIGADLRERVDAAAAARAADEALAAEATPVATKPGREKLPYGAVVQTGVLFLIVMGGIFGGIFTATESAAFGALAAGLFMVVYALRTRSGLWKLLFSALQESVSITSMVFMLLIGSTVFASFLLVADAPDAIFDWVTHLSLPPWLVVVFFLLALIPMGMFLDGISMLLIWVPLSYPVVTELGFDGIWYGILVVKMIEIGLLTPPVGMNVFVIAGAVRDLTVAQGFRGVAPFILGDVLAVAVLFAFPQITLVLPQLAAGG
ncbi:TRAP transporter large permease [Microbacterium sp. No. 7]|uniref:TRAP transporter large permease n=1 Tax=Microbacterium sp. No. 7 TaxID=1714373 RepID=UPI0006D29CB7|nr:TRAP transporter large permease [Microbacterium sp. No. 7]ALJ20855.1 hypothetical protein AOA12_13450 [Microbacterium sp. No. 7]